MTVEQHNVIDSIGTDKSGRICLIISDHLPWDEKDEHLLCLQEKLNTYLRFIESGEIYEHRPEARERPIVVTLALKYPPPARVQWFLTKVSAAVEGAGCRLDILQIED